MSPEAPPWGCRSAGGDPQAIPCCDLAEMET